MFVEQHQELNQLENLAPKNVVITDGPILALLLFSCLKWALQGHDVPLCRNCRTLVVAFSL